MAQSEAVLTLLLKARNLADAGVKAAGDSLDGLASRGSAAASRIGSAFTGAGKSLAAGLGQAVESLTTGGDLGSATLALGGFMAGELTQNFGESLLERFADSGLVATLTAPLAGIGSAIGGLISAAIPIGMAALPFLLIGALVAVVAVLIASPDIRNKVLGFAGQVVQFILDGIRNGLSQLGALLVGIFTGAWSLVVNGILPVILRIVELWLSIPSRIAGLGLSILSGIIDGLSGLPGRLADIIGSAFRSIHLDIGPFHISSAGVQVDLPKIDIPHFAAGVRGFTGGMALVGERGPELVRLPRGSDVVPNASLRSASAPAGVVLEGVSPDDLLDMVERGLYFRLRRAGTLG